MRLRIINEGISPKDLNALKQRDKVDYKQILRVNSGDFEEVTDYQHNYNAADNDMLYNMDNSERQEIINNFTDGRDFYPDAYIALASNDGSGGYYDSSDEYVDYVNSMIKKYRGFEYAKDVQQLAIKNIDNPKYGIMLISIANTSHGLIEKPVTNLKLTNNPRDIFTYVAVLYRKDNFKALSMLDFAYATNNLKQNFNKFTTRCHKYFK